MLNDRGLRTRMGKPWSPAYHRDIITNRVYLGEKRFRDIVVEAAHQPIIDAAQFDLAQRILDKRSADIGQRAANPSDYTLTGKIRCPQCHASYIGTAAHGRTSRYRYYVCWSRARYGSQAGCDIHRFIADQLETAIGQALLDFYTTAPDVIAAAVARVPGCRRRRHQRPPPTNSTPSTRELKNIGSAVDRYLVAFEKRPPSTTTTDDIRRPPAADPAPLIPQPDRRDPRPRGTPNARKALFEALIEEIQIHSDDTLKPIFRVPLAGNDEGLALNGPAPDQINSDRCGSRTATYGGRYWDRTSDLFGVNEALSR